MYQTTAALFRSALNKTMEAKATVFASQFPPIFLGGLSERLDAIISLLIQNNELSNKINDHLADISVSIKSTEDGAALEKLAAQLKASTDALSEVVKQATAV